MTKPRTVGQGIYLRGDGQYQVKVRRRGQSVSKTFETLEEAQTWRNIIVGKISGDEYVDRRIASKTTLAEACDWYLENRLGTKPNAKNVKSKLAYWKSSPLSGWALSAIHDWDLIEWRRDVLDEDNAEDGDSVGPDAEVGAQAVIHRLDALSRVFQEWSRAHQVFLDNPVKRGVRPSKPHGRDRRLMEAEDSGGMNEEERLLVAAGKSSRSWLQAAIIISLATAMRQSELASLTWDKVKLDTKDPHIDLPKTKNDRARRIPLSVRAVAAFRSLEPKDGKKSNRPVLPIETPRAILHAFRDAVSERDFPDLRWHDLRHEAISRLFDSTDYRDQEVMAISGHLSPSMLTRYTHLRAHRLGDRLPGGKNNPFTARTSTRDTDEDAEA